MADSVARSRYATEMTSRVLAVPASLVRGTRRRARDERGFTLIEAITGMMLFAFIAVALIGLLNSAIAANTLSRQKTVAQQMAQDQVEDIRRRDYADIGTPSGNPPGTVPVTRSVNVRGVQATMTTQIQWVDDPTPTSYATAANYKKVTVTLTSNRDGRVLTKVVTYIAPPSRAPYGGINNAILNVIAKDLQLNTPIGDASVSLSTGPSAPRNDTTDPSTGLATFAALTPNPTSGAQAYYDIAVAKGGYETYVDYISPAAPAHIQLAPSQTADTTILLYLPVTINVSVLDSGGNPYAGTATVKLSSERSGTTQTYTATGGATPAITNFASRPAAPGNFTARAFTSTLCANPVTTLVPTNYPVDRTYTFALQLQPCPSGTLTVNVTQLGGPAVGANVQVSLGPNEIAPISGTTNASGSVTFTNLPSGTDPYTITVMDAPGNVSASTTATISTGVTTTKNVNLNNPPMGSISALVRWLGANVNSATVTVTGGPYGINLSQSTGTGGSGTATFSNTIPAGSGYTVTATKNGQSRQTTNVTVTAGSTTNVTPNMPTGTINVAATWAGRPAGNVNGAPTVTVTGGPDTGGPYNTTITNSGGTVSIVVPATTAAYPYTVTVSKNGGSGSAMVATLADGGSAPANVVLTPTKTFTITIQRGGVAAANTKIDLSITGGPNGTPGVAPAYTFTLTTNAFGVLPVVTVPRGTAGSTYTIKANLSNTAPTPCPAGLNRSGSIANQSNTGASTNVTVNMTSGNCPFNPLP
jgi:type II secretory pathway pseudopilin PulG